MSRTPNPNQPGRVFHYGDHRGPVQLEQGDIFMLGGQRADSQSNPASGALQNLAENHATSPGLQPLGKTISGPSMEPGEVRLLASPSLRASAPTLNALPNQAQNHSILPPAHTRVEGRIVASESCGMTTCNSGAAGRSASSLDAHHSCKSGQAVTLDSRRVQSLQPGPPASSVSPQHHGPPALVQQDHHGGQFQEVQAHHRSSSSGASMISQRHVLLIWLMMFMTCVVCSTLYLTRRTAGANEDFVQSTEAATGIDMHASRGKAQVANEGALATLKKKDVPDEGALKHGMSKSVPIGAAVIEKPAVDGLGNTSGGPSAAKTVRKRTAANATVAVVKKMPTEKTALDEINAKATTLKDVRMERALDERPAVITTNVPGGSPSHKPGQTPMADNTNVTVAGETAISNMLATNVSVVMAAVETAKVPRVDTRDGTITGSGMPTNVTARTRKIEQSFSHQETLRTNASFEPSQKMFVSGRATATNANQTSDEAGVLAIADVENAPFANATRTDGLENIFSEAAAQKSTIGNVTSSPDQVDAGRVADGSEGFVASGDKFSREASVGHPVSQNSTVGTSDILPGISVAAKNTPGNTLVPITAPQAPSNATAVASAIPEKNMLEKSLGLESVSNNASVEGAPFEMTAVATKRTPGNSSIAKAAQTSTFDIELTVAATENASWNLSTARAAQKSTVDIDMAALATQNSSGSLPTAWSGHTTAADIELGAVATTNASGNLSIASSAQRSTAAIELAVATTTNASGDLSAASAAQRSAAAIELAVVTTTNASGDLSAASAAQSSTADIELAVVATKNASGNFSTSVPAQRSAADIELTVIATTSASVKFSTAQSVQRPTADIELAVVATKNTSGTLSTSLSAQRSTADIELAVVATRNASRNFSTSLSAQRSTADIELAVVAAKNASRNFSTTRSAQRSADYIGVTVVATKDPSGSLSTAQAAQRSTAVIDMTMLATENTSGSFSVSQAVQESAFDSDMAEFTTNVTITASDISSTAQAVQNSKVGMGMPALATKNASGNLTIGTAAQRNNKRENSSMGIVKAVENFATGNENAGEITSGKENSSDASDEKAVIERAAHVARNTSGGLPLETATQNTIVANSNAAVSVEVVVEIDGPNKSNAKNVVPVSIATDLLATQKETAEQRNLPLQDKNLKKRMPEIWEARYETKTTHSSLCGVEKPARHNSETPRPSWRKPSKRAKANVTSPVPAPVQDKISQIISARAQRGRRIFKWFGF